MDATTAAQARACITAAIATFDCPCALCVICRTITCDVMLDVILETKDG